MTGVVKSHWIIPISEDEGFIQVYDHEYKINQRLHIKLWDKKPYVSIVDIPHLQPTGISKGCKFFMTSLEEIFNSKSKYELTNILKSELGIMKFKL